MDRKVIAIDFDGTLRRLADGGPIKNVVDFAARSFDAHDFVVIYTARPEEDRDFVDNWLKENSVKFDLIQLGKLRFDVLIDDKTIRPEEVNDGEVWRNLESRTREQAAYHQGRSSTDAEM